MCLSAYWQRKLANHEWAREHFCSYCEKNILTTEKFKLKLCRSSYLRVLVHANREILKSPLHVGVDGELSSEWTRMLATQPQQAVIRRKYIPVERHHFRFITGTANTQQDPTKLLGESGKWNTWLFINSSPSLYSEEGQTLETFDLTSLPRRLISRGAPLWRGRGYLYISLINQGFWCHLKCSWRNATISSSQSMFQGALSGIF